MSRLMLPIMLMIGLTVNAQQLEKVTDYKGQQVTGISVNEDGRSFVNFPRWRESVKYSVMEISENKMSVPYPDARWNSWKPGKTISDSLFVAVQSVVAKNNKLYVLDTRNPLWKGVVDNPRIFVFDLKTNSLIDVLKLSDGSFKANSYTNDLRVDDKNGFIYMTDSNEPGIIIFDRKARTSRRILDQHYSTSAETDHLMIDGKKWGNKPVHSDGIALDETSDKLFYHALTGKTLYSVSAKALREGSEQEIEGSVKKEALTPSPDGMILDKRGNLYMADLEKHAIVYISPKRELKTLVKNESVGWADTFSIYGSYLYFTNSNIHRAGSGAEDLSYPVFKIKLPE
ncbi:hypothetical protein RM51_10785 [Chryseobacterium taiwanense]|uniref:Major royal jelly protein n=1 Tax=Chryseobacterium taiwanense TaxID=363331 RepID=A0A0B4E872_9FLAO|nr:hypothetical protein RM51_10785 [Chryseobacterium taiwanense]